MHALGVRCLGLSRRFMFIMVWAGTQQHRVDFYPSFTSAAFCMLARTQLNEGYGSINPEPLSYSLDLEVWPPAS
eukprot:scaffold60634_cov40-Cyclotella_meneghiniana.AAC.3